MSEIKLEDIYYFSVKKLSSPAMFDLVNEVVSNPSCPEDRVDIQRRLALLPAKTDDAEHVRQCSNFVAEAHAYSELLRLDCNPHWVSEEKYPTPDMKCDKAGKALPVEVKHLNSPRDEHDALFEGKMWGGNVSKDYHLGLQKKVEDFVKSAKSKFQAFNLQERDEKTCTGLLYIYYSKSIDAMLNDMIDWETKMHKRIEDILVPLIDGDDIEYVIIDIDTIAKS